MYSQLSDNIFRERLNFMYHEDVRAKKTCPNILKYGYTLR